MEAGDGTAFLVSSHDLIRDSLTGLLKPAEDAGAVRSHVRLDDLLRLVNGVALATDGTPEGTDRLLALAWHGITSAPAQVPTRA
jgi:hypothetical protein